MKGRPPGSSYDETMYRVDVFKRWVEDKEGYRSLNTVLGTASEAEVQRLIFLALQASSFEVNREVNNGRGPVDFKVSGRSDTTLLEIKLARNSQLKRNLERQVAIYEKANETKQSVKVIIAYTEDEIRKVHTTLKALNLDQDSSIVTIDARSDNKPSGSKA